MAKKGFIARIIDGPERSETYAASTLPTNRWQLGWDTFKTNKGKLFGLNLLTLVFFIPLIILFLLRYVNEAMYTDIYPFAQNMGLGYPLYPATVSLSSQLNLQLNFDLLKLILIGVIVASVGISGGFYVMRNMVWAEGVMVASDFFKGVKQNFFVVLFSLLFYTVVMMLSIISINISNVILDLHQGVSWLLVIAQIFSYGIMALATSMVLFMLTLGVTYKLSFAKLIRNSFILSIGLIPTNVFFALFSAIWFILLLVKSPFILALAIIFIIAWGVSLFMLVWTDYSHWVFDKFINDKVPGAKKNRGIYNKQVVETQTDDVIIAKSKLKDKPIKPITDYDVEIYELPTSFSRKDLEKLEETKEAMRRDSDKYAEDHKDDYLNKVEDIDSLMSAVETNDNDGEENDK